MHRDVTKCYLFTGAFPPPCGDAADANDDGIVDISVAIRTLGRLFMGGEAFPAPGPTVCGPDPTEDKLDPCQYPPEKCGG